ncbi:DUF4330 domain-containing protein [Halorussus halophilus]|uniref:DUF4330 domain-containing protein n=1 Tax=Halorussus halophilus TaxID=2650975 RepID=UPI0013012C1A|nr:DUF4330 domain-containing protein [Halorussus halophilus]
MDFIDDQGRLFGKINIIDALAVLLVLAVAAAGTAFVLGADEQATTTNQKTNQQTKTTVTYQVTGVQPYVADAIPNGPIKSDAIAAVTNKSVRPTEVIVTDQNGTLYDRPHPRKKTVTLQLSLNTTKRENDVLFRDKPLEVGRQLTLDFGPVTVKGTVTKLTPKN